MAMLNKVYIFILFSFLNQFCLGFNTATIEEAEEFGRSVSRGRSIDCTLDIWGVKCKHIYGMQDENGQLKIPKLHRPRQIAVGGYHTCAIDDHSVKCWGRNDEGQINVPRLYHPKQIAVGETHSCALDGNRVLCWGQNEGRDKKGILEIPLFKNPMQLLSGSGHVCVLDDNNVKCWGENGHRQTNVPALINPIEIALGYDHSCALDDEGVKCWGHPRFSKVPNLKFPRQIFSSDWYTYALDDTGLKCWGKDEHCNNSFVPDKFKKDVGVGTVDFDLSKLHTGLLSLSNFLYSSKSHYILGLSELSEKFEVDDKTRYQDRRLFMLSNILIFDFIHPLIELTTSDFIQTRVLPAYQSTLKNGLNALNLKTMNQLELSTSVFDVVITTSSLALKSLQMSILSPGTKKKVEIFLAQAGTLKAEFQNGYDRSQATKLLNLIQQNKPLITELTQNKDTEPFALVLLKVESFLAAK